MLAGLAKTPPARSLPAASRTTTSRTTCEASRTRRGRCVRRVLPSLSFSCPDLVFVSLTTFAGPRHLEGLLHQQRQVLPGRDRLPSSYRPVVINPGSVRRRRRGYARRARREEGGRRGEAGAGEGSGGEGGEGAVRGYGYAFAFDDPPGRDLLQVEQTRSERHQEPGGRPDEGSTSSD